MELTVREVATLLGRSARAVRAQASRGEIAAVKRGGRWVIPRRSLPLNDVQRAALEDRARQLREAVEAAIPPRRGRSSAARGRSLADLEAFRRGARLLAELRTAPGDRAPAVARASDQIEQALMALAEGVLVYDRQQKLQALDRARSLLAHAAALLLIGAGVPPERPALGWAEGLEGEVIPAVAGLARWAEHLPARER